MNRAAGEARNVRGNTFVQAWFQLIRIAQLHAIDNDALQRPIRNLVDITAAAGAESQLSLQMKEGALLLNGARIRLSNEEYELVHTIATFLKGRGLGGFTIEGPLTAEAVRRLLSILIYAEPGDRTYAKIETALTAARLPFIIHRPPSGEKSGDDRILEHRTFTFFLYAKLVILVRSVLAEEKLAPGRRGFLMRNIARTIQLLVDVCREDAPTFIGVAAVKNEEMYAGHHAANVAVLAIALGRRLGMGKAALADLGMAAIFHDAGMRSCPIEILEKPGPLDQKERAIVAQHPLHSVDFLLEEKKISKANLSRMVVAFEHHRHNAGTGFPPASRRPDLLSRIVTICDAYDAMSTKRPWRKAYLPDQAIASMLRESGPRFDPALLKTFVSMLGVYPIGSLVRLDSGQLAVVVSPGDEGDGVARPLVTLVGRLAQPEGTIDLQERTSAGAFARSIVSCEEPARYGIQISSIIAAGGTPSYGPAAAASGQPD
ncbi:MAG TPA: HD domain-containing phosphohydrolase [Thermoanaerobaculia bacterium]|nr:HD domain-containing phosphohydrolase [Thermoanaerobaculia bacterium]